jgi:hypothetical protein
VKRIWHPWTSWECIPAGMYDSPAGRSPEIAKQAYANFLGDTPRFEAALERVITEWPISCEHFLSNEGINRIAWLGQASMCIATGVPACFRGGFKLLHPHEQRIANAAAEKWLRIWLRRQSSHERQGASVHRDMETAWLSL